MSYQGLFIIAICLFYFSKIWSYRSSRMVTGGRCFARMEYVVYCFRYQRISRSKCISPRKVHDWAREVKLSTHSSLLLIPIILNHLTVCWQSKNAILSQYHPSFIFKNRGNPNMLLESNATNNTQKQQPKKTIPVTIYIWLTTKITDCQ